MSDYKITSYVAYRPVNITLNIFDRPDQMDWRMQCDKCRREAVLFQEYSGLHLCKQHFEADFERKAKHEIRSHHWLVPGDHIAVALSGDANSSALLCFLKKLTSSRRDIQISAISIDEGRRVIVIRGSHGDHRIAGHGMHQGIFCRKNRDDCR